MFTLNQSAAPILFISIHSPELILIHPLISNTWSTLSIRQVFDAVNGPDPCPCIFGNDEDARHTFGI